MDSIVVRVYGVVCQGAAAERLEVDSTIKIFNNKVFDSNAGSS